MPGTPGRDGRKGDVGARGEKGESGESSENKLMQSNWKQCAWKIYDGRDHGLIQVDLIHNYHFISFRWQSLSPYIIFKYSSVDWSKAVQTRNFKNLVEFTF